MVDGNVVGVINVQGHGKDVVSVAPEIFEEYRGKRFAYKSLSLAYTFAKDKGFKELTAGIREENFASQKLHEKLGFKYVKNSISRNGNVLKIYSKQL
jgi:RimJ/RimL family protein N-acetyltransferase